MKVFFKTIVLLLVFTLFTSTAVFAKSENAEKSLVALGDSIPYGFNLGQTNSTTSKYAFPYLIGEEADVRVRNLSEPGWTTGDLLQALEEQKYRQAVKHADYITLNIGSNDLIQALKAAYIGSGGNVQLLLPLLNKQVNDSKFFANLESMITEIRSLTDAPIVVYNIYNPFQTMHPLHEVANAALPSINGQLLWLQTYENVTVADAFGAFGQNQATYILRGDVEPDVHPTIAGQEKLAEIGLEALELSY